MITVATAPRRPSGRTAGCGVALVLLVAGCSSGSSKSALSPPPTTKLVFDRSFVTPDSDVITVASPLALDAQEAETEHGGVRTWRVHLTLMNGGEHDSIVPEVVVQCGAQEVGAQVGGTLTAFDAVRPGASIDGDYVVSAPASSCAQPRLRLIDGEFAAYSDVLATP
ncbi:MAG: hypothetical protein JWM34_1527 [Ilumatobacteraceae bacterium]|nr:hypothetical protein [Ilumatobacteraceae bacterium]